MHSEFEESEAKIAATLAARQSAESGAKDATESAMSEATEATAAVDTLVAKLAETRQAQEEKEAAAARHAEARRLAEERNGAMVEKLAAAQRRLEAAMQSHAEAAAGLAAASPPPPMAAVVADTVEVTGHAEVKGPPLEPELTPAPAEEGAEAEVRLSKEEELLQRLSLVQGDEGERYIQEQKDKVRDLRQRKVAAFYEKQEWFQIYMAEPTHTPVRSPLPLLALLSEHGF